LKLLQIDGFRGAGLAYVALRVARAFSMDAMYVGNHTVKRESEEMKRELPR